jgi:hypothetical protein
MLGLAVSSTVHAEKSLELQAEAEARAEELRSVFVELVGLSHRAAAPFDDASLRRALEWD